MKITTIRKTIVFPLLILALTLVALSFTLVQHSALAQKPSSQIQSSATAIDRILNQNETLNLSTGFQGSLGQLGWHQPSIIEDIFKIGDPGLDKAVNAIAVNGSDVYVGGYFRSAGGARFTTAIAKWNGSNWSDVGFGVNGNVHAIAVSGSKLYVGGSFNQTGDIIPQLSPKGFAEWDGYSWSDIGSGSNGINLNVEDIAVSGGDVYVAGIIRTFNFIYTSSILKWNGSKWSDLGGGIRYGVDAIAVNGSDVYAGGSFSTTASGVAANNIAKWDGNSWSALGSGINGYVYAIAVSGSDVYVGGNFSTAGGIAANNIAKWDGNKWSAVAGGFNVNGIVQSIAVSGSDVYVGGYTLENGLTAGIIRKWDGSKWSDLGGGINSGISAIAVSGSDIYVGGGFTSAGGVTANHITKVGEVGTTLSVQKTDLTPFVPANRLTKEIPAGETEVTVTTKGADGAPIPNAPYELVATPIAGSGGHDHLTGSGSYPDH